MANYKMLFLDIDGTTIKPDNTIEDSTKEAIEKLKSQGIRTVLATGRPIHELDDISSELNIHSFIGYNGALGIYDGETIFAEPMDYRDVNAILETAKGHGHDVVLYSKDTNYFTDMQSADMSQFAETFHLVKNAPYTPEAVKEILGITIITSDPGDQRLYRLPEDIHLSQVNVTSMHHCYDVIRDKVNKGVGVKFLLDRLGIPREASIAFGDGMNDKEMLSYVGDGFAMGNAHEELFSYAKHKTTSVTDSGIYNGLKSLGLLG